jgi:hypothetical protein
MTGLRWRHRTPPSTAARGGSCQAGPVPGRQRPPDCRRRDLPPARRALPRAAPVPVHRRAAPRRQTPGSSTSRSSADVPDAGTRVRARNRHRGGQPAPRPTRQPCRRRHTAGRAGRAAAPGCRHRGRRRPCRQCDAARPGAASGVVCAAGRMPRVPCRHADAVRRRPDARGGAAGAARRRRMPERRRAAWPCSSDRCIVSFDIRKATGRAARRACRHTWCPVSMKLRVSQ